MKYTILFFLLFLCGCDNKTTKENGEIYIWRNGYFSCIVPLEINGHQYILTQGNNSSHLIHDQSCPCLKKAEKE